MTATAKRPRAKYASHRRHVLARVAQARELLATVRGWWDVSGTVYDQRLQPGDINCRRRNRQPSEYPEVNAEFWAGTVNMLDQICADLQELRGFCAREHQAVKDGLRG